MSGMTQGKRRKLTNEFKAEVERQLSAIRQAADGASSVLRESSASDGTLAMGVG